MPGDALTVFEREAILEGVRFGLTDGQIGARIGRHRCTVNAELGRNGGRAGYSPTAAQQRADAQRCRPKVPKMVADPVLAAHVAERLEAKDSPMTISVELARGRWGITAQISHECIYQAIHNTGRGLDANCWQGLHLGRRRRKHRNQAPPTATHSLGEFSLIGARPPIAAERVEVGHLEGDLIVGAYNRSALITVFDRASRYLWLGRLTTGKNADGVLEAMTVLLERIPPPLRLTLAWDQGSEMARHLELAARCAIAIYFAEPKSPWQRPTNESGNALVRRYVGKGTDLTTYTLEDLTNVEQRINTIPRRSLGWDTAQHHYDLAVASTT